MDAELVNYIKERYPMVKAAVATCWEEGPKAYHNANNRQTHDHFVRPRDGGGRLARSDEPGARNRRGLLPARRAAGYGQPRNRRRDGGSLEPGGRRRG
jgi:hypothetical protein